MIEQSAWPWIAAAYFFGLSLGVLLWWIEKQRRILWQQHAEWLGTMIDFWRNSSNRMLDRCVQAREQAEGYRDAFLSLEDVDAVCCCLPWEDHEAWQAKWDDTGEDEDGEAIGGLR